MQKSQLVNNELVRIQPRRLTLLSEPHLMVLPSPELEGLRLPIRVIGVNDITAGGEERGDKKDLENVSQNRTN